MRSPIEVDISNQKEIKTSKKYYRKYSRHKLCLQYVGSTLH